ncbi:hypothetical protein BHM03_00012884 [Ensete ventricosum]|nr:hypothetical protein BHM03_00012884 [Ensete ventricosum]
MQIVEKRKKKKSPLLTDLGASPMMDENGQDQSSRRVEAVEVMVEDDGILAVEVAAPVGCRCRDAVGRKKLELRKQRTLSTLPKEHWRRRRSTKQSVDLDIQADVLNYNEFRSLHELLRPERQRKRNDVSPLCYKWVEQKLSLDSESEYRGTRLGNQDQEKTLAMSNGNERLRAAAATTVAAEGDMGYDHRGSSSEFVGKKLSLDNEERRGNLS